MATFLALYRGPSFGHAELISVTTDQDLVGRFAEEMIARQTGRPIKDPAAAAIADGQCRALRIVREEARESLPAFEVEP